MSFLLGVLLLVSGVISTDSANSTAQTATAPTEQSTTDANKAGKDEKKICRREETPESRIGGKKICLTADQWRRVQRER